MLGGGNMEIRSLAIDIGASSGRLIQGTLEDDMISLEEIHRFKNQITNKRDQKGNEHACWELDKLYNEILVGIKKSKSNDIESIGIDTWAVDFVLLNSANEVIGDTVSYRCHRTDRVMEEVFDIISKEEIYNKTGIQFLQFNTIYQLYAVKKSDPEYLEEAKSFLMVPDYFNYLLTGKKSNEYTNATSTQLFNVSTKSWDQEILKQLDIPSSIFNDPVKPGTVIGEIKDELKESLDIEELKVIAPATHDTGSSIVAVPTNSADYAYISSGTWSLMGVETKKPICTKKALEYNFTNEGGAYETNRFLKNIMGLWLIQEVKKELNDQYDFGELVELAKEEQAFKSLINPNDSRFLNPESMIAEIKKYCQETEQVVPQKPGELARCIFESLAFQYKQVLEELTEVTTKEINKIHIIGGGVQNEFLNQLTADITGLEVYAGPIEATAIGNLLVQYIALGYIDSLEEAREIVSNSFTIKNYTPNLSLEEVENNWIKFKELQN
jgi:rhamnulokinase